MYLACLEWSVFYKDLFISNGILRRPNDLDFRMYIASTYKYRDKTKSKDEWLLESLKEMPKGIMPNQIFKGNSYKFQNKNSNWIEDYPIISNSETERFVSEVKNEAN